MGDQDVQPWRREEMSGWVGRGMWEGMDFGRGVDCEVLEMYFGFTVRLGFGSS